MGNGEQLPSSEMEENECRTEVKEFPPPPHSDPISALYNVCPGSYILETHKSPGLVSPLWKEETLGGPILRPLASVNTAETWALDHKCRLWRQRSLDQNPLIREAPVEGHFFKALSFCLCLQNGINNNMPLLTSGYLLNLMKIT